MPPAGCEISGRIFFHGRIFSSVVTMWINTRFMVGKRLFILFVQQFSCILIFKLLILSDFKFNLSSRKLFVLMKKLYVSPFSSRTLVETESSILASSGQAVQVIAPIEVEVHEYTDHGFKDVSFDDQLF